ncbi:histidine kinase [Pasteurellaceae bacterium Macca]|nr:histidine kinase [Pasteurellaceae bacterium Macca]
MDYLDRLLQLTPIEGEINTLCRFQGNWKIHHTQQMLGIFHIVSKGECCVQLAQQCYHLSAGDVIFLPYGEAHTIATNEQMLKAESLVVDITKQDYGAFTLCANRPVEPDFEMFCGYFRYPNGENPLFQLPKWHLASHNSAIMALLNLLRAETTPQLGNRGMTNALCRILFGYLVRDYLAQQPIHHGILGALQDKRLQNALNGMLANPEYAWNMEQLAERCLLSRASFIRLFKEKTGMLAGKFLTLLRLQKAEMLLKHSDKTIQQIASEVGYQSEAHFCKLFKTQYHCSPTQYRESSPK